jgi:cell wall-associated NlpC family hydrolase
MKKKLLTAVIAASLILSTAPLSTKDVHAADSGQILKSVNFRDQPSLSSNQIRYLQQGEQVDIIEKVNNYWYKIQDQNDRIGYMTTKEKYILVLSQSNISSSNGTIVSSVSFRSGPSTGNFRIRYLQSGENVTILSQPNSYWYEVSDQYGQVGYVSSNQKYISTSFSEDSSLNEDSGSIVDSSTNAQINSSVSFRTGPSTSNSRIRYLQTGENVTILSQPNSYWYQVRDQHGQVGYTSSNNKYINTSFSGENTSGSNSGTQTASGSAQDVINAGKAYLGTPYEFGSSRSNTSTFDCSDFVRQAFMDGAGIRLPADSRQQGDYVKANGSASTNWRNLNPGDIMFFMSYEGTSLSSYSGIDKSSQRITHDGIYLGNGQILHTYSQASGGVTISNIENTHWEYRFIFGGSAL